MTDAENETAAAVPDILVDCNAVLGDHAKWRTPSGEAPDYSKANANFESQKTKAWDKGSLEDMVSNLVKNWEKEASYKVSQRSKRRERLLCAPWNPCDLKCYGNYCRSTLQSGERSTERNIALAATEGTSALLRTCSKGG